jgi:hypothetical protein
MSPAATPRRISRPVRSCRCGAWRARVRLRPAGAHRGARPAMAETSVRQSSASSSSILLRPYAIMHACIPAERARHARHEDVCVGRRAAVSTELAAVRCTPCMHAARVRGRGRRRPSAVAARRAVHGACSASPAGRRGRVGSLGVSAGWYSGSGRAWPRRCPPADPVPSSRVLVQRPRRRRYV